MSLKFKTYEVTLAWRNIEDGDIGPEFTRTQIAWSEDEAVEAVVTGIEAYENSHPDFGIVDPINELELRGVKEIAADEPSDDTANYDDSGFRSLLA